MVASIKVGSPKLKGAGAPRAGSEAHWTSGHGARGRTGLARSLRGAELRCGAPGVTHSRGLPPGLQLLRSPSRSPSHALR